MKSIEQITIERQANGDYVIAWDESFSKTPVDIYAAESPADAPGGKLISSGQRGSVTIENLREPVRHYFHLVPQKGAGVTYGERALSIRGGTNLRDLGGYVTADGRKVQWGRLYRSGQLSIVEPDPQAYLATLGITVNCDFRHARDFVEAANTLPEGVESLNYPVDAGSFSTFLANLGEDQLNETSMVEAMCDVNRQLVRGYQGEYRNMFEALLTLEDGGFLVNCTAGKDRTGFASALILLVLGVPWETIVYDYLLSTRYFRIEPREVDAIAIANKYSPRVLEILKSGVTKPLREVRAEYLGAAFDTMEDLSGSVEQYLEDVYGVGPAERTRLRERYTVRE